MDAMPGEKDELRGRFVSGGVRLFAAAACLTAMVLLWPIEAVQPLKGGQQANSEQDSIRAGLLTESGGPAVLHWP